MEIAPSPITEVTVTLGSGVTTVSVGSGLSVNATWSIPGGTAAAGDTFTLTLPTALTGVGTSFPLLDSTGTTNLGSCAVTTGSVSPSVPATIVCTLGGSYNPALAVNGTLTFQATVNATAAGDTGTWSFTTSSGSETVDIPGSGTVEPAPATCTTALTPPTGLTKSGAYTNDGSGNVFWWFTVSGASLPTTGTATINDSMTGGATLIPGSAAYSMSIYQVPTTDYRAACGTYYGTAGYTLSSPANYAVVNNGATFDITFQQPTTGVFSDYIYVVFYYSTPATDNGDVVNTLSSPGLVSAVATATGAGGSGAQDDSSLALVKQVCASYNASGQPTCTVNSNTGWAAQATIPNGSDALWRLTATNDGASNLTNVSISTEQLSGGTGYAIAGVKVDAAGTYSFGNLAIGASQSVLLPRTTGVTETTTAIVNTAQVQGFPADASYNPTSTVAVVSGTATAQVIATPPSDPPDPEPVPVAQSLWLAMSALMLAGLGMAMLRRRERANRR